MAYGSISLKASMSSSVLASEANESHQSATLPEESRPLAAGGTFAESATACARSSTDRSTREACIATRLAFGGGREAGPQRRSRRLLGQVRSRRHPTIGGRNTGDTQRRRKKQVRATRRVDHDNDRAPHAWLVIGLVRGNGAAAVDDQP
ncbi:MAG: hypothetical protein AAF662_05330 [Pseudomonadota bacterium]